MYADRMVAGSKRSIKDRLNVDFHDDLGRSRKSNSKRQHQSDDNWKRDLYDDEEPQTSKPRVGPGDLRFKLQKKASQQSYQGVEDTGGRDLREMLSGRMRSQPQSIDLPKAKLVSEVVKPIKRSVPSVEAHASEYKKSTLASSRKKSQQMPNSPVDGFICSLGLEKYLILFQAEEIDMTVLRHMTDDDLKTLGIPMGPRKKILSALESSS